MSLTQLHQMWKGSPAARGEKGFSLIEVIIALGLLATVLISIASLFILGGKQVRSGKNTTYAVALSNEIIEQIDQLGYQEVYEFFGGTDSSTSVTASTTDTGNNANQWQADVVEKLGTAGAGTIDITPLGGASPLNMGSSDALRVRVTLTWNELGRPRSIVLQSTRF